MHGFTISVSVLLLPIFQQLLLRKRKISRTLCFETSEGSVQTADDNYKDTLEALRLTLVSNIFKLVLYFNSIIISNQIKYHLALNR